MAISYEKFITSDGDVFITADKELFVLSNPLDGFNIEVYNFNRERSMVDKSQYLTNRKVFNGLLRDVCDITSPVINIEVSEFPTFNYAYIPSFSRYYFVKNITSLRTNIWSVELDEDVLMTYSYMLLNLDCLIDRNEFDFNNLLIDECVKKDVQMLDSFTVLEDRTHYPTFGTPFIDCTNLTSRTGNISLIISMFGNKATYPLQADDPTPIDLYSGNNQWLMTGETFTDYLDFLSTTSIEYNISHFFADPVDYFSGIKLLPINSISFYRIDPELGTKTSPLYYYIDRPDNRIKDSQSELVYGILTQRLPHVLPICVFSLGNVSSDTFVDYPPFTETKLFLPYYGFYNIENAAWFTYDEIAIELVIDYTSTEASYVFYGYRRSSKFLLDTVNFTLSIYMPIGAHSRVEELRKGFSAITNMIGGMAGTAALTVGAVGAMSNPATAGLGAGLMMGAIGSGVSTVTSSINGIFNGGITHGKQLQNNSGGACFSYIGNKCILIRSRPNIIRPSNYNHLYGRPLLTNKRLGELDGTTKIGDFHLDNFTGNTKELAWLDNALHNYVFLTGSNKFATTWVINGNPQLYVNIKNLLPHDIITFEDWIDVYPYIDIEYDGTFERLSIERSAYIIHIKRSGIVYYYTLFKDNSPVSPYDNIDFGSRYVISRLPPI